MDKRNKIFQNSNAMHHPVTPPCYGKGRFLKRNRGGKWEIGMAEWWDGFLTIAFG